MHSQFPHHSPCRSFFSLPEAKRAKPSSLPPPQRTLTGSGLLAGGFPHQMLRLPARSSFNPPVVPGLEHGLGVVGADEGVGAVPSLACMRLWFTCARPFEEMPFSQKKHLTLL